MDAVQKKVLTNRAAIKSEAGDCLIKRRSAIISPCSWVFSLRAFQGKKLRYKKRSDKKIYQLDLYPTAVMATDLRNYRAMFCKSFGGVSLHGFDNFFLSNKSLE